MKQELFELDDMMGFVNDRLEKLDWLIFRLMEEVTDDNAIVASLALDTVMATSQKMDKIQALIKKLREQDTPKVKGLERLQKVA